MSFNDLFKKEAELREAEDKTAKPQPDKSGANSAGTGKEESEESLETDKS